MKHVNSGTQVLLVISTCKIFAVINRDLVFSDLNFGPLCSEIATVKVVIPNEANIAFSDYLVAIPSGNPFDLATSIGFCDLDPCDGGWSQNPM